MECSTYTKEQSPKDATFPHSLHFFLKKVETLKLRNLSFENIKRKLKIDARNVWDATCA